jgi:hypothetical protein
MIALGVCLAVAAALVAPLRGEEAPVAPMPVQDTTAAFCYILKYLRLTPLQRLNQLDTAPERTLLVVFGKTDVLNRLPGGLTGFLDRGGAAIVATDQDSSRTTSRLGITVHGNPVLSPPGAGYRSVRNCPLITNESFDEEQPLFRGIKRIATNCPSYLGRVSEASIITWLPPGSYSVRPTRFRDGLLPFAASQQRQSGRVLVLADHSIFIDEMMLQKDNDNFDFAFNCVEWLTTAQGRRGARRDRVLFVYDDEIISNFGPPLPEPPTPPIPPLNVNQILTELERKDIFNRLILDQVRLERILQVLFSALSLGLVAYCLHRLQRARHRPEPAPPVPRGTVPQSPTQSLVVRRHHELLSEGNVWEVARALARQFFESVAGTPPNSAVAAGGTSMPGIVLSGDGRRERSLADQVRRLWKLAYGAAPTRVSPRQLEELIAQLEALQTALSRGTLRLERSGIA